MNPSRLVLLAALTAAPAYAQNGDMAGMPGMTMPIAPAAKPKKPTAKKTVPAKSAAKATAAMPAMTTPMDHAAPMPMPATPQIAPMPAMDMKTGAGMKGMDMKPIPGMEKRSAPMHTPETIPGMDHGAMAGMSSMGDMPGMNMTGNLGSYPMTRDTSGTSWQPDLAEHHGIHAVAGDWQLMVHAMLWGIYDTQSGPRGDDKTFAAGMLMGMARRDFGASDALSFRAMLSPDPFMGKGGYPLLLATGETASGTSHLVDRQHPHDLFMELSGTFSHQLGPNNSLFLYAGYPGEPALGPPAFMHRASGMDIPQAPITHHWLDSTHITFGVLTGGFVHDDWKLEISQFTGREPDQYRYNFDTSNFDSTAIRVSYNPGEHWSLQTSWGYLKSPEQLDPATNENRYTASATYNTKFSEGSSVAATLGWGLKDLSDGKRLNGIFLEVAYKPAGGWTAFSRAEWEQNSEIDATGAVRSVGDLVLGGIRDWLVADHMKIGFGAAYTFNFLPSIVAPTYGNNPHGAMIFTRLTLE